MKFSRKKFLKTAALGGLVPFSSTKLFARQRSANSDRSRKAPLVISTWNFGVEANRAALEELQNGRSSMDAVESGVRIPEADPSNRTVGYGGRPDRDGHVTLDACVMDGDGKCGSVAFLQHIKHPVSVARKVMEETPHVMLVGRGALQFALEQGFKKEELLIDEVRKEWEEWKKDAEYRPIPNIEMHDTIGMLAIDHSGNLSGGCSTSGMAWKMHGRVGDSPLIGSALFVDNEVGAATATGHGEEIIRIAGSHLVVERMRQGDSPVEACREAVRRIVRRHDDPSEIQAGFIALNKHGEAGGYAVRDGFSYAVTGSDGYELIDSDHEI